MLEERTTRLRKALPPAVTPVAQEACLVLLHPACPLRGKRIKLVEKRYLIGRSDQADIKVDSEMVSRRHAMMIRGDQWTIEDLGSLNGVFVNDQPKRHSPLFDRDIVSLADATFKFLSGNNIEATFHEEIYRLSTLDSLTGTYNQRYFREYFAREASTAARHRYPLSLIMLDLDHFKEVNDTYGHMVGDMVLKMVAARVSSRLRKEDLLARYGGEEFVVVLPHTSRDGAAATAESLRRRIADSPVMVGPLSIRITASLGVATWNGEEGVDPAKLLELVDANLYAAKKAGRDCIRAS